MAHTGGQFQLCSTQTDRSSLLGAPDYGWAAVGLFTHCLRRLTGEDTFSGQAVASNALCIGREVSEGRDGKRGLGCRTQDGLR